MEERESDELLVSCASFGEIDREGRDRGNVRIYKGGLAIIDLQISKEKEP